MYLRAPAGFRMRVKKHLGQSRCEEAEERADTEAEGGALTGLLGDDPGQSVECRVTVQGEAAFFSLLGDLSTQILEFDFI